MESGASLQENPQGGALHDLNSPFQSECLSSALELLEILRAEGEILKRFAGAELLELIPRKEYLVSELEWKLESARAADANGFTSSDSFRSLIGEITRLNTSNGVFIKKSLSYWQDLMSIFLPSNYAPPANSARRQPLSPKGLAFRREV